MEGAGRGALLGRWFLFWVAQTSTWATVSRLPIYFVAQGMEGEGTRQTLNTSGGGCHGGCSPEDHRNRAAVNGFPI